MYSITSKPYESWQRALDKSRRLDRERPDVVAVIALDRVLMSGKSHLRLFVASESQRDKRYTVDLVQADDDLQARCECEAATLGHHLCWHVARAIDEMLMADEVEALYAAVASRVPLHEACP